VQVLEQIVTGNRLVDNENYHYFVTACMNAPGSNLRLYAVEVENEEIDFAFDISPEEDALSGIPNETVVYNLTLTNIGNLPDTIELTFENNLWGVNLPETSFELDIGQNTGVLVRVTIPADALHDEQDTVIVTATSQGDESLTASSTLTTTTNAVYGLTLLPEEETLSAEPGEVVDYTLTLTNTGNVSDTFVLSI
jgi:uncharacterized membrane protein